MGENVLLENEYISKNEFMEERPVFRSWIFAPIVSCLLPGTGDQEGS